MRFFILLLILIISSSASKKDRKLDLHFFSIEIPENWKYIKKRGYDSFVGEIAIDEKDTLTFDYGMYSNSLNEELNLSYSKDSVFKEVINEDKKDTLNVYIKKYFAKRDTLNIQELYLTKSNFEIIYNLKAKVVTPKKSGIGLTGVYFEKIKKNDNGIKLKISGNNLSTQNQLLFLKAIRTIKFKN
jgi:hypothetical protein